MKGHFNDPDVAYCATCGISMLQASREAVAGARPPLGVLVFDDGTTLSVQGNLVLGRAAEEDPGVSAGRASPVRLQDPAVSRVHARIVLDGWRVTLVDAGSRNGTFVATPGQPHWTRLPPGERAVLKPGTLASIGGRQLRYHSYRSW